MHRPEDHTSTIAYEQAARFRGERPAGRAYFRAQAAIRDAECDLSVFRLRLEQVWHVAVLGQAPPEHLDRSLRRILAAGESTTLPADLLKLLWERRAQATELGTWCPTFERYTVRTNDRSFSTGARFLASAQTFASH